MPRLGHPRARRGDIPAAVLALLKEADMHGYQIIQEISDRTDGAWTPSPGSIYPALQLLEDQGMVESTSTSGKRVFALTEVGRKHADMLPEGGPWQEFVVESDPERKLRESFISLMQATKQIGSVGSPEQIEETAAVLGEARKRIYAMLAGDE
jgi:DNA-binding PadR family transcriptional regulator